MANGESSWSVHNVLTECLKRLQQPDGKKRVQDKLRSIGKRSKHVNIFEPLEIKVLRLCLPLVTDMLSDVVTGCDDRSGKSWSKAKSDTPADPNALLIRFLYEAKRQSADDPEIAAQLKQLQDLIQQIIDAAQSL